MFAGGRRVTSNNVKAMQLFHELKQQFPTIPDHVVSACIATNDQKSANTALCEIQEAAAYLQHELMGRNPTEPPIEPVPIPTLKHEPQIKNSTALGHLNDNTEIANTQTFDPNFYEMNATASDLNRNVLYPQKSETNPQPEEPKKLKRPDHLDIKKDFLVASQDFAQANHDNSVAKLDKSAIKIQPSEKCKDVHKLLNENILSDKPPRSPVTSKRIGVNKNPSGKLKDSPLADTCENVYSELLNDKTETCLGIDAETSNSSKVIQASSSINKKLDNIVNRVTYKAGTISKKPETPTPTPQSPTVNVSLNVNCSMDVNPRRTTSTLHVIPQHPWSAPELQSPSGRSFTKVNLTLRSPSAEPQAPIDITSQNSSLTYSTSSFDSQKGMQSQLQITVGPTGGSVSSIRTRPRSSYHPDEPLSNLQGLRTASLPDLLNTSPVMIKQQARIERLRIELTTEKTRLISMQREVVNLENSKSDGVSEIAANRTDKELEKQLHREIRHLRGQCERLTLEVDNHTETRDTTQETTADFYGNIYTGQRGHLAFSTEQHNQYNHSAYLEQRHPDSELSRNRTTQNLQFDDSNRKWNCSVCTFQNHPLLNKCELCEMPRILHGNFFGLRTNQSMPNINLTDANARSTDIVRSGDAANLASNTRRSANLINVGSGLNDIRLTESQDFVRRYSVPTPQNRNRNPLPVINQVSCPDDLQFETQALLHEDNTRIAANLINISGVKNIRITDSQDGNHIPLCVMNNQVSYPDDAQFETDFQDLDGFRLNKRDSMNNLLILSEDSSESSSDSNIPSSSSASLSSNTPLIR